MTFTDSGLWTATLASRPDNDFPDHRRMLSSAFLQFRDYVLPVAEEISQSVPGYTNHGISHCDSLWDTASKLMGSEVKLNPAEAFVLGGAFLIHDLGMGLSAYPGGLRGIITSIEWLDVLAEYFPKDYKDLQAKTVEDVERNPTWDGLSNPEVKAVLTVYLRMNHASQAEKILGQEWPLSNGQTTFLLPDARLRNWYAQAIGKIAKSHWQDVAALPEIFPGIPLGAPGDFPSDWTVDELKLACLLRLADAAQIDDRRADILLTPHRQPQGESLSHWQFQERLMAVQVVDRRLVFNSSNPFPITMSSAWWNAFDAVKMIDDELRKVDNLCADLGRPRFGANAVAGADSSIRFAAFVKTDGWRPVDARPHIGNPKGVISQLGGKALYGQNSNAEVAVRELVANALDATRAFRLAFPSAEIKPIVIEFAESEQSDIIRITDSGIGMAEFDVIERLCNFGSSGWKGEGVQSAFPGLLSEGYTPTGQFGIGFFAVFMVADRVKVITRHVDSSRAETLVLEFSHGLAQRPLLRNATREEQLLTQGTSVEITLTKRLTDDRQMFSRTPRKKLHDGKFMAACIRSMALMADETIVVKAIGSAVATPAVGRHEWKSISNEEVFDAINPGSDSSTPGYDLIRKRFADVLAPIEDSQGNEIGRIGVNALTTAEDGSSHFSFIDSNAYTGGLYAKYIPEMVGILAGRPSGAARKDVIFDVSLPQLQQWFRSQIDVLNHHPDDSRLVEIQNYGVSLGVLVEKLPLALSRSGYLSPPALREFLLARNDFIICERYGDTLTLSSQQEKIFGFFTEGNFVQLPDGLLVVHYGRFRPENEELPMRPNELAEVFSELTVTHQGFDPIFWWNDYFASSAAELVRLAAEVWQVDLEDVVRRIKGLHLTDKEDNRLVVETLGGTSQRVPAMRVRKFDA